jgi:L-threonylcarbamoyladenylate synthase
MMLTYQTIVWNVDKSVDNLENNPQIQKAAALIQKGEVVAFPTETVYGLGADATNEEAVAKIFWAKGRPQDNPLIVHIANLQQLHGVVAETSQMARQLMERFWPGPLTLILPAKETLAKNVTAGLDTVGVRMPAHPVALALIRAAKCPLAAPSANRSGRPSPTEAKHVQIDLNGKIPAILDAGPTGVGVESTVVDARGPQPVILRPGGISREAIAECVGVPVLLAQQSQATPLAPGMKYRHYAPDAKLVLLAPEEIAARLKGPLQGRIGVLTTEENENNYPQADTVIACGRRSDLSTVAAGLFAALRRFDEAGVDLIYAETFPEEGIGLAIMNRLRKAAANR